MNNVHGVTTQAHWRSAWLSYAAVTPANCMHPELHVDILAIRSAFEANQQTIKELTRLLNAARNSEWLRGLWGEWAKEVDAALANSATKVHP